MFRRLLVTSSVAASCLTPAAATDLPAAAPPPFTWAGLYFGAQGGNAWSSQSETFLSTTIGRLLPIAYASYDPAGVIGGVHLGYNFQPGVLVYGLEGEADGASISRTATAAPGVTLKTSSPVQGAFRAGLGVGGDRWLIYAAGGLSLASVNDQYAYGPFFNSFSKIRTGWNVGAGVDYAVTDHWQLRGEYRYTDFARYTDRNIFYQSNFVQHHFVQQSVLVGGSYKLDSLAPVAVAKR